MHRAKDVVYGYSVMLFKVSVIQIEAVHRSSSIAAIESPKNLLIKL